jgi:hypothetical protein
MAMPREPPPGAGAPVAQPHTRYNGLEWRWRSGQNRPGSRNARLDVWFRGEVHGGIGLLTPRRTQINPCSTQVINPFKQETSPTTIMDGTLISESHTSGRVAAAIGVPNDRFRWCRITEYICISCWLCSPAATKSCVRKAWERPTACSRNHDHDDYPRVDRCNSRSFCRSVLFSCCVLGLTRPARGPQVTEHGGITRSAINWIWRRGAVFSVSHRRLQSARCS